jgi:hypothetical protein
VLRSILAENLRDEPLQKLRSVNRVFLTTVDEFYIFPLSGKATGDYSKNVGSIRAIYCAPRKFELNYVDTSHPSDLTLLRAAQQVKLRLWHKDDDNLAFPVDVKVVSAFGNGRSKHSSRPGRLLGEDAGHFRLATLRLE